MSEGEYIAIILLGASVIATVGLFGLIGAWVYRHRQQQKHNDEFFGMLDEKKARTRERFRQNMGRRYGSKGS